MDVFGAIGGIGAAFGLSTSAGLNAYIPMIIVALAARFPSADPMIHLTEPYDVLSSWWMIGILFVLLIIEMTVDKIPAIDTINDLIHTVVRPTAGAILFAASANVITDLSPVISLGAGLILAGSVHATKATVRPVVTASTVGTGNWLVSIIEDVIATIVSILAILIPIFGLLAFALAMVGIFILLRRRRKRRSS
jgi:hypothetical protein